MLTINNFKKGDKVYILTRNMGRNTEPSIRETEVVAVGRIYVKTSHGAWEHKYENCSSDFLHEKVNCGEATLLFQTQEDAGRYIEKMNLARWLGNISISQAEKFTLEQLRRTKDILTEQTK